MDEIMYLIAIVGGFAALRYWRYSRARVRELQRAMHPVDRPPEDPADD